MNTTFCHISDKITKRLLIAASKFPKRALGVGYRFYFPLKTSILWLCFDFRYIAPWGTLCIRIPVSPKWGIHLDCWLIVDLSILVLFGQSHVALDRNPGPEYNTLLLRLIQGDLLSACPHRRFHTLPSLLESRAALSNSYTNTCVQYREQVCTNLMIILGITRPGREPTTYRVRAFPRGTIR